MLPMFLLLLLLPFTWQLALVAYWFLLWPNLIGCGVPRTKKNKSFLLEIVQMDSVAAPVYFVSVLNSDAKLVVGLD